jgi:hypothetical protein
LKVMSGARSSLSFVLPLLIGGLLLQATVSVTLHQHEPEAVLPGPDIGDHWCSHRHPEAFSASAVDAGPACLACVIPTPALGQPSGTRLAADRGSATAQLESPERQCTPSRRWKHRLRAPPVRV